mmetsp:Transcript_42371/g.89728  ORF Transcript_42371/g.89728 Transcript_42371/m.89728 type:complete len:402 (+) Transcript_42371:472-1677(+)
MSEVNLTAEGLSKSCNIRCLEPFCARMSIPANATSCAEPSVSCAECSKGAAFNVEAGHCVLTCQGAWPHCLGIQVPQNATTCETRDNHCVMCKAPYKAHWDGFHHCTAPDDCTPGQHDSGCAPGSCEWAVDMGGEGKCSSCVAGYVLDPMKWTCARSNPQLMHFYAYTLEGGEMRQLDVYNSYNLAGILWHLGDSIVGTSCPERRHGVQRIVRYNVSMWTSEAMFDATSKTFAPASVVHEGQYVDGVPNEFATQGFSPGCARKLLTTNQSSRGMAVMFSFPGPCPSLPTWNRTDACRELEPGGQCQEPDGTQSCTWNARRLGAVSLDELTGIGNYAEFCKAGGQEYNVTLGRGVHNTFWNSLSDFNSNMARMKALSALFSRYFPWHPPDGGPDMPDPPCDV